MSHATMHTHRPRRIMWSRLPEATPFSVPPRPRLARISRQPIEVQEALPVRPPLMEPEPGPVQAERVLEEDQDVLYLTFEHPYQPTRGRYGRLLAVVSSTIGATMNGR